MTYKGSKQSPVAVVLPDYSVQLEREPAKGWSSKSTALLQAEILSTGGVGLSLLRSNRLFY
jgi:hypothetical protein